MLQSPSEGRALTPVKEEPEAGRRKNLSRTSTHNGDDLVLRCASRGSSRPNRVGSNSPLASGRSSRLSTKGGLLQGRGNATSSPRQRVSTLTQETTGLLPRLASKGDNRPDSKDLIQLFRVEPVNLAEVEGLLKRRPGVVNRREEDFGWPPIMFAAHRGSVFLIKRILEARGDHRAACNNGNTALQLAARGGHVGAVQYLITAKADLNKQNKNGWSALTWSASGGHEEVVESLLMASASLSLGDEQGRNACMWAARNGHAECVLSLAASGLDLAARDRDGLTVAEHAWNFMELRAAVLASERANSSLFEAAKRGDVARASSALEDGAAVNAKASEGGTVLSWAMVHGSTDVATLLLQHGAQPAEGGADAEAEVVEAGMGQAARTCEAVEHALGTRQAFIAAAMDGNWEEAKQLLEQGAFIDTADELARTAFVWAAVHGSWEMLMYLAEARADLDRRDSSGWGAVHYAAQRCELETVSTLYHLGADFSARTHDGQTLQHLAAGADGSQTLQLLAAARADFNALDSDELVPAQVAAIKGRPGALGTLLALKASADVKDHQGRSLFLLAACHGHVACLRLLVANLGALPWDECAGCVATVKPEAARKSLRRLSSKRSSSSDLSEAASPPQTQRRLSSKRSGSPDFSEAASPTSRSKSMSPENGNQRKPRKSVGSSSGLLPALPEKSSPKSSKPSRRGASKGSSGGRPKKQASGDSWASLVKAAFTAFEAMPSRFAAPYSVAEALGHRDKDGRTALALSVEFAQPRVQAFLLELRAAPDAEDLEGNTALMLGAVRGDRAAVESLLEADANTEARNKAGKNAFQLASQGRLRHMLKADLDRKLVTQRLGKSGSLPALTAKIQSPERRPLLPEGQRRFRLEGLQGEGISLEARIRTLFRGRGCGAKLMQVTVALDPITQSCRGFAHVDLAFADKRQRLQLDGDEVEVLLGARARVVEELNV